MPSRFRRHVMGARRPGMIYSLLPAIRCSDLSCVKFSKFDRSAPFTPPLPPPAAPPTPHFPLLPPIPNRSDPFCPPRILFWLDRFSDQLAALGFHCAFQRNAENTKLKVAVHVAIAGSGGGFLPLSSTVLPTVFTNFLVSLSLHPLPGQRQLWSFQRRRAHGAAVKTS